MPTVTTSRTASPPTTPPTMDPARLFFADDAEVLGVRIALELGSVFDVDDD